jgi:hypothetical protein
MKKISCFLLAAILFLLIPQIFLFADDHVVEESTRTYMGRTLPPMQTEYWVGKDALFMKTRSFSYITRYDLKKKYIINLRNKKYLEEALDAPQKKEEKKPFRIQEFGTERYNPVYDWVVRKTDKEKVIDDKKCRLYILDGDADYAEEKREMWVTEDVPIDALRFFERLKQSGLDDEWKKVYEAYPELKKAVTMRNTVTSEHSIAPTMVWNFKLVTVEVADPPEGIYSLPEGLTEVKTREELYARGGE